MNPNLYDLDPGPESPDLVRMIVEIPKGSTNKYEYDGKLGLFRLDRALYSPVHYPGDYGSVPGLWRTTVTLWMCWPWWSSPAFAAA